LIRSKEPPARTTQPHTPNPTPNPVGVVLEKAPPPEGHPPSGVWETAALALLSAPAASAGVRLGCDVRRATGAVQRAS
jgi:hypothetical protein